MPGIKNKQQAKEEIDVLDRLVDWRREAREEEKNLRFCPQCGNLVRVKLKEHKYYQNFYGCPICGETILSKGMIRTPNSRGYRR